MSSTAHENRYENAHRPSPEGGLSRPGVSCLATCPRAVSPGQRELQILLTPAAPLRAFAASCPTLPVH